MVNTAYIQLDKETHSEGIEHNYIYIYIYMYTMFQLKLYPNIYYMLRIQSPTNCNNGHFLLLFCIYNTLTTARERERERERETFGNTTTKRNSQ